jgi:hypothetical protein
LKDCSVFTFRVKQSGARHSPENAASLPDDFTLQQYCWWKTQTSHILPNLSDSDILYNELAWMALVPIIWLKVWNGEALNLLKMCDYVTGIMNTVNAIRGPFLSVFCIFGMWREFIFTWTIRLHHDVLLPQIARIIWFYCIESCWLLC